MARLRSRSWRGTSRSRASSCLPLRRAAIAWTPRRRWNTPIKTPSVSTLSSAVCATSQRYLQYDIDNSLLPGTYAGHYEPIKEMAALLDEYEARIGHSVPIYVYAASGGFTLVTPMLEWDFSIPCVVSVNTSGHKFARAGSSRTTSSPRTCRTSRSCTSSWAQSLPHRFVP